MIEFSLIVRKGENPMYMVFFVLNNNSFLEEVLNAWRDLGFAGATIMETAGQHRCQQKHIPMRFTFGESPSNEVCNTTLFLIVENKKQVNLCLEAVESVVGDLDKPNTGVFSAWPISITKGVFSYNKE
jgi:nitrogen regulatory protein P-II 1